MINPYLETIPGYYDGHVSFAYIWQLNLFKLVALQPNASIKSSKEVSEIEITDHSSAEGSLKIESSISSEDRSLVHQVQTQHKIY